MHPNRLSPPYQLFILTLSLFAIGLLALQTTQQLTPETSSILAYADYALCALFFLDFLICLYNADNRLHYLRTWGWLDLLSSIPMLEVARLGRAARALRIIRVLRGIRATRVLSQLILQRRSESTMLAATLVALLLIVVSSIAILNVENDPSSNIKTAEDAVWWACTTITTVGYGDKFAVTSEGRASAVVLMVVGVGLFGTFSGFVAAWCLAPAKAEKGKSEMEESKAEIEGLRLVLVGGDMVRRRLTSLDGWRRRESLVTSSSRLQPVKAFNRAVIPSWNNLLEGL